MGRDFVFTVEMAVYQVKDYIDEAVKSIMDQTIGFDHIHIIFVDDGSTDGSSEICDRYKERYPDQIDVIHKENGGISSARNAGLKYIRGKYVSFLDPDDWIDPDAFQKVADFMDYHPETDVCCIPYFMFGDKQGPHPLNYKFDKGSRVIDLMKDEDANSILLSAATAFYRAEVIREAVFDTDLVTAEDAKVNAGILLKNPHLGVVSDTAYHYRRYADSLLGRSSFKKGWYLDYLYRFTDWVFDEAEKRYGYVPKFIQHMLMYDLQWKVTNQRIRKGVLSKEEEKQYQDKLMECCMRIDEDVILSQRSLRREHKAFLIYHKDPEHFIEKHSELAADLCGYIHFVDFEKDHVKITGRMRCIEYDDFKVCVRVNDKVLETRKIDFDSYYFVAGMEAVYQYPFEVSIPYELLDRKENRIIFERVYGSLNLPLKMIFMTKYAPVNEKLKNSYYICDRYLLECDKADASLRISKLQMPKMAAFVKELAFLWELLMKKDRIAFKAVICRIVYHIYRLFMPEDIWLISDRADRADDNGEALFRYLCENRKDFCHPIFAIREDVPDHERMTKVGKTVPYMSWRYKILHLLAKHTVSAYSFDEISAPFPDYSMFYGDLLQRNKIVFLQHGIIKDDLVNMLNRFHKNYALFVTSTKQEYDSIVNGHYGYDEENIIMTGLPRYDRLYDEKKKYITIMPTWESSLVGANIPEEGIRRLNPGFEESDYYRFYTSLLTDERLLDKAEELGYEIRFFSHPVLMPYVDRMRFDSRVRVLKGNVSYREIFAQSALITTDYSSVFFDFAYLKKPVVYTQFKENHYEAGYFDYERDGFGEVVRDLDSAVELLIGYMENGCQLKKEYEDRIDAFYAYHDRNNCERVCREILDYDKRHER